MEGKLFKIHENTQKNLKKYYKINKNTHIKVIL